MGRLNCWEVRGCGREPGGKRAQEGLGVCPAATENRLDGCNRGTNGGRACWAVEGTQCEKTFSAGEKFSRCVDCLFFRRVDEEEGRGFEVMGVLLDRLRSNGGGG